MNEESVDHSKQDLLIVDDTPVNLRALASILAESGYKVRKALDGKMALTACDNKLPDLILLDIMIPDMDGYEVLRWMLWKGPESGVGSPLLYHVRLLRVWIAGEQGSRGAGEQGSRGACFALWEKDCRFLRSGGKQSMPANMILMTEDK